MPDLISRVHFENIEFSNEFLVPKGSLLEASKVEFCDGTWDLSYLLIIIKRFCGAQKGTKED